MQSRHSLESNVQTKQILMITEVIYGSGDFFAAKKVINQLQQAYPDLKIQWLVRSPKSRKDVPGKIDEAKKSFTSNVTVMLGELKQKIDIEQYRNCSLVLLFPTVYYISFYDSQQLNSLKAKILQIHEYDAISSLRKENYWTEINTGFDGMGLFLDDLQQFNLSYASDAIIAPAKLNPAHEMFFSYLNQESEAVVNGVNFNNFAHVAIRIAAPEKSVDIIANSPLSTLDTEFNSVVWDHGFSEIIYIRKDKHNQLIENVTRSSRPGHGGKQLRIINPFPISQQQMQTLMANAHPFLQTTGDQSLSEVMSVASLGQGAFPFYQMMHWKSGLHANWLQTAKAILGNESPYAKLLSMSRQGNKVDANEIAEFWIDNYPQILSDSVQFFDALYHEKKLSNNLTAYLRLLFYVIDKLPDQHFTNYAELLAQLVVKLKDDGAIKGIMHSMNSLQDVDQQYATINALTEFLKMNPANLTEDSIKNVAKQLMLAPVNDKKYTAVSARKILSIMPSQVRDNWVEKLIPELSAVSSSLHFMIISELEQCEDLVALQKHPNWLCNKLDHAKIFENIKRRGRKIPNNILLAVDAWSDGYGDIAKFIGIYHHLKKSIPDTRITTLVRCEDINKQVVLAMLRENDVAMNRTSVWTMSAIEKHQLQAGLMSERQMEHSFLTANFDSNAEFSLIISVATPFPEINSLIRRYSADRRPYIEIGEVNACSYQTNIPQSGKDKEHHLYAMGLNDHSVGLEISSMPEMKVEEILVQMNQDLAKKLLGGELTKDKINEFISNAFFMPAYLKNDEGIFSLHFALELMAHHFTDKQTGVLWVHSLPFDVNCPQFLGELRNRNIASITVYDEKGKRLETRVEGVSGERQLRILCGRVESKDFDLMYKLASLTGGFGACVGQNSFEKVISFDLVPAFYAPSWQIAIIEQCQDLLTKLFSQDCAEYQCLNDYLSLLFNMSNSIRQIEKILNTSNFNPYKKHLKSLPPQEFQGELIRISAEIDEKIVEYFPYAFGVHPLLMLQQFFKIHDITLLQSAWRQVCAYIKTHKNLNHWLVAEVKKYLSPVTAEMAEENAMLEQTAAMMLVSYQHCPVSVESMPALHDYLRGALEEVWPAHEKIRLKVELTDSDIDLVQIVPGMGIPLIVVSINALLQLTKGELRFALRMTHEIFKRYPVENSRLRHSEIGREELAANITGDLEHGITYFRKHIALINISLDKIYNHEGKTQHWYDVKYKADYARDMIKAIEFTLAKRHQHELAVKNLSTKAVTLPEPVLLEALLVQQKWQAEAKIIESRKSSDVLTELLNMVPELRIKNLSEYTIPAYKTRLFMNKLSELHSDASDHESRHVLELIAEAVFEHRCASLTDIYCIISDKLSRSLLPLGPFKILKDYINKFFNADSHETFLDYAQKIEDFLQNPLYTNLFKNTNVPVDGPVMSTSSTLKIDEAVHSSIGAYIEWDKEITWPSDGSRYKQIMAWCSQPGSEAIATVLFRLGMVDNKTVWDRISHKFIAAAFEGNVLLGKIPDAYADHYSFHARPILNTDLFYQYLNHRYGGKSVIGPQIISRETIELFIRDNMELLALTNLFPKPASILMGLFEKMLATSSTEGQILVRQFYLDSNYPYGLTALSKLHQKFDPVDGEGKYDYYLKPSLDENNTDNMPYLQFLLKTVPDYLSIDEVLDMLEKHFNIYYSSWPLSYFFKKLNLSIYVLSDVVNAVKELANYNDLLRSHCSRAYIMDAISNIYKQTAQTLPHINLFAEETYQFIKQAKGSYNVCQSLFNRFDIQEQICAQDPEVLIAVTALAELYQIFDQRIVWPTSSYRDHMSKILLRELDKATDDQQLKASNILLQARLPLTDVNFVKVIIARWVTIQSQRLGKDDNSYVYYAKLSRIVTEVLNKVPAIYRKDMLEGLTVAVDAQEKICDYIDAQLNPPPEKGDMLIHKEDMLITMAKKMSEEQVSMDLIRFFTHELTRDSLDNFLDRLTQKQLEILDRLRGNGQPMDRNKTEVIAIMLYHEFWNCSIEERAVIMNNLLIPSSQVGTEWAAKQAYSDAFIYITDLLFPNLDEESEMSKALLASYLDAGNEYVRSYLLAAVLTANKMAQGKQKKITNTLPKLAEAMGAAGVKAGQAAHSYPHTPPDIREALAYLKNSARLPYRWELWALIKKTIPSATLAEIKSVKKLLGGASFYIAIEVEMQNGQIAVLRLMRDKAHEEAQYGFAHLKETLNLCRHPSILNINKDLSHIIDEAEAGAQIEINHECVGLQYEIADKLYNNVIHEVKVEDCTYHVRIEPVRLFSYGPAYQLISMANGIEFNDLKKDQNNKNLCKAVAFAVCKTELTNMLGSGPCDFDRHGAQARVLCHKVEQNIYHVTVTNYDFGEISPLPATTAQLDHCRRFIDNTRSELFSFRNFINSYVDDKSLMQQLTERMIEYVRQNTPETNTNTNKKHDDLTRLRGIFKGILALNDYFEVITNNKTLMLQLSDVLMQAPQADRVHNGTHPDDMQTQNSESKSMFFDFISAGISFFGVGSSQQSNSLSQEKSYK